MKEFNVILEKIETKEFSVLARNKKHAKSIVKNLVNKKEVMNLHILRYDKSKFKIKIDNIINKLLQKVGKFYE